MLKLVSIQPSTRKDKKLMAMFNDNTITHFGAKGYSDYTIHKDPERKQRYIDRHSKEDWSNPKTAGTLSRYILWNLPTLQASIRDFKKRFNV